MDIKFNKASIFNAHILSGTTIINLFRLLADNKFAISLRFIPRLLLVLPIILLNIPFVILERLLYDQKIKNTIVKQPVFILGYPRSGTTFLMYLLSKDPRFAFCKTYECMGPGVIFTFGPVLRKIAKLVLPAKRPMDNLELGADVPKEEEFALGGMGIGSMANALYFPKNFGNYFNRFVLFNGIPAEKKTYKKNHEWLLKKLTLKNNNKQLLLKSPFNTGRIKVILEMYPDAKFIHIHRHPYSVFLSNEKLYESILPQVALQTVGNLEMKEHVINTYRDSYKSFFNDKTLLKKEQLFEMSYKEFIANPAETLKNVYAQLNLEGFETALPYIIKEAEHYAGYKVNKHAADNEKLEMVYSKWKDIYNLLGYKKEL